MAGGGGQLRSRCRSCGPLHPRRSPLQIDTKGDGIGVGSDLQLPTAPQAAPHSHPVDLGVSLLILDQEPKAGRIRDNDPQAGRMRADKHYSSTWWDRYGQRLVIRGVDFAPNSQEGPGNEFVLIPDSFYEAGDGGSFDPDDDEVVPETEAQDLEAEEENAGRDGVGLLSGAAEPLQKIGSSDAEGLLRGAAEPLQKIGASDAEGLLNGAAEPLQKVALAPGMTSDAETEDEDADD